MEDTALKRCVEDTALYISAAAIKHKLEVYFLSSNKMRRGIDKITKSCLDLMAYTILFLCTYFIHIAQY